MVLTWSGEKLASFLQSYCLIILYAQDGIVQTIIDEGVKVVETAGRSPASVVKKLKAAGIIVMHKCTSIRHALSG